MNSLMRAAKPALAGRVAIVTGGGRGIGRAIAKRLALAGASVVVTARSEEQLRETLTLVDESGGSGLAIAGDVTRESDVEQVVSEAERTYGPVDLLVNNAGTSGAGASLWEVDADAWRHVVEVNLFGAFLYTRRALKSMVSGKKGTIVNMCSNAALRPLPLNSEYSCSKAALIRFTECTAEAVRELGISVFAISPGLVHTTMTDGVPVFRNVPTDQWSLPERAADLIVFLASGVADSLSGRYIHVSDDVRDMVERAEEIRRQDLHTLRLRK